MLLPHVDARVGVGRPVGHSHAVDGCPPDLPNVAPASSWDVTGPSDEAAWRYHVNEQGPSGSTTMNVPSASVLHFRLNVESRAPWRGVAPLTKASTTGALAAEVEDAIRRECANIWSMRILPTGRTSFETWQRTAETMRARRGG